MPQANSQHGNPRAKVLDQLFRNSRFARRTWSRRYDDPLRIERLDFGDADLVVAHNVDLQPVVDLSQPLYQVVGERIVVIEDENHHSQSK